jgi:hypothetical protein
MWDLRFSLQWPWKLLSSVLKFKTADSSKRFVTIHQTTRRFIPEENNLHYLSPTILDTITMKCIIPRFVIWIKISCHSVYLAEIQRVTDSIFELHFTTFFRLNFFILLHQAALSTYTTHRYQWSYVWCFLRVSHQQNNTYDHVFVFTTYNNAWIRKLFLTRSCHIINVWQLHLIWDKNCIRNISCNKWSLYTASAQTETCFQQY